MDYKANANNVLHWNYRGFTEFPLHRLQGDEAEITDIYLKENLISRIPSDIGKLNNLESLYLSGNDITQLPREISELSCLKCLDLSGNRLQYIPDEIGKMRSLKFLILDENELRELPLRIAELRMLRYLSVCDNKLQWLPQRPVYNYHHCEFRFWRNPNLGTMPYSLWYHMFRGQQTRSLNIGCLSISICDDTLCKSFVLQLYQNIEESELCKIYFPKKYEHVLYKSVVIIPSLMELCKRKFYQMIYNASKKFSTPPTSIYSDKCLSERFDNNNHISSLQDYFQKLNLENSSSTKINGNKEQLNQKRRDTSTTDKHIFKSNLRGYCVPSDIIKEHYYYLPQFIKVDLCNGPISRCENVNCRKPVFDFVYFECCLEKIILIEDTEDVLLSAIFCSKSCADIWKTGKSVLSWKFV